MLSRFVRMRTLAAGNDKPVISFTFDGFSHDFTARQAELLEAHGGAGTFYTDPEPSPMADEPVAVLDRLLRRGHDVGLLGAGPTEGPDRIIRRKAQLDRALRDGFISSYAYRGSRVPFWQKLAVQQRFTAARSALEGVNSGEIDLGLLRSVDLNYTAEQLDERACHWLKDAVSRRGWLILAFPTPLSEDDMARSPLKAALDAAQGSGFEILTVRNALGAVGWPRDSTESAA